MHIRFSLMLLAGLLLSAASSFPATEIPDHLGIDFRDPVFSSVDGQVFSATAGGFTFFNPDEGPVPSAIAPFTWSMKLGIGEDLSPILINTTNLPRGVTAPFLFYPNEEISLGGPSTRVTGVWLDDMEGPVQIFDPPGSSSGITALPDKHGVAFVPLQFPAGDFFGGRDSFKIAGFSVPDDNNPLLLFGISIAALFAVGEWLRKPMRSKIVIARAASLGNPDPVRRRTFFPLWRRQGEIHRRKSS